MLVTFGQIQEQEGNFESVIPVTAGTLNHDTATTNVRVIITVETGYFHLYAYLSPFGETLSGGERYALETEMINAVQTGVGA